MHRGEGNVNLDGQLQQIIDELLRNGISLDLARKEFEKKYIGTPPSFFSRWSAICIHTLFPHPTILNDSFPHSSHPRR